MRQPPGGKSAIGAANGLTRKSILSDIFLASYPPTPAGAATSSPSPLRSSSNSASKPITSKRKGEAARRLTIDRIDVTKGYSADNIQVLTNSQNVFKQHYIDYNRSTQGPDIVTQYLDDLPDIHFENL